MRNFIQLLSKSYLASYIVAYAALIVVTLTKVEPEVAVFGSLFYALGFGFILSVAAAFLDALLPWQPSQTQKD